MKVDIRLLSDTRPLMWNYFYSVYSMKVPKYPEINKLKPNKGIQIIREKNSSKNAS